MKLLCPLVAINSQISLPSASFLWKNGVCNERQRVESCFLYGGLSTDNVGRLLPRSLATITY